MFDNKDVFKINIQVTITVERAPFVQSAAVMRTPVYSSVIKSVGYNVIHRTLTIEFQSGAVYEYNRVPAYVYDELMDASSAGEYFNREIKPFYTGTLIQR